MIGVYRVKGDSEIFSYAEEILEELEGGQTIDWGDGDDEEVLMALSSEFDDPELASDAYRIHSFDEGYLVVGTSEDLYVVDFDNVLSKKRPGLASRADYHLF